MSSGILQESNWDPPEYPHPSYNSNIISGVALTKIKTIIFEGAFKSFKEISYVDAHDPSQIFANSNLKNKMAMFLGNKSGQIVPGIHF